MSGRIQVEVHRSLDAVSAADWERLAAGRSVFQDRAWYEHAPAPGALRLLVARRGDGPPLGVLPLHLLDRHGHYYHDPREVLCGEHERALLVAAGAPLAPLEHAQQPDWLPALVSVGPYGYRGGLVHDPGDPAAFAVAQSVAAAAEELGRREGVRLTMHYNLNGDDDPLWAEALAAQGGRPFVSGADCNLDLASSSLADWFRAAGRRGKRLRYEHRRARREPGVTWRVRVLEAGEQAPGPERLVSLFAAAARARGDEPPVSLYRALAGAWPGRRIVLTGESEPGRVRSAVLALVKGTTLSPKLFGSSCRGDYFFLMYTALVEAALEQGLERIEYGGGSHQAKLLRGARLRWLTGLLHVYDGRLEAALRAYLPLYEDAKRRHFEALALRYQIDHRVPPAPGLDRADRRSAA
jgi:predicted N-acyltransferase